MNAKASIWHLVKTALIDFRRNKVRSILTSLGIMIGVLSVVLLIALGLGLKNFLKEQFESLGSNLIIIFPGNVFNDEGGFSGGFGTGFAGGADFDEKDVRALRRIREIDFVVPVFFKSALIEANGEKELGNIQGVNEEVFEVLNLEPVAGEILTKTDINTRSKNVVLGFRIAEKLFETPEGAIGKTVRFENQRFKVIGVVDKTGDSEQDNGVILSYKTTFGSINPDKSFFTIYLGVNDESKVQLAAEKAEEVLLKRYDEDDFSVAEQTEILSSVNQIFSIVNGVLLAIGSISLIVGGIGIMNIMYASVTERTKEIGIRRAVGATQRDVLMQFLTESLLLSVFGGILGLLLATIIVLIIRFFFPAAINLLAVLVAIGVSSGIGIFFGVFPARRAAKLPPIEAIRYE